jgi:hypothetical protein
VALWVDVLASVRDAAPSDQRSNRDGFEGLGQPKLITALSFDPAETKLLQPALGVVSELADRRRRDAG